MNFFKKVIAYIFRDELSIRHKLVNVILGTALLMQIPVFISSLLVGTSLIGVSTQVLMAVFIGIVLYFTNRHPDSTAPSVVITIVCNIVVFPIMYFLCGGYATGMTIWMLFGAIFTWLLVN